MRHSENFHGREISLRTVREGEFEQRSERWTAALTDSRASLVVIVHPKRRGTTLNWWTFRCFGRINFRPEEAVCRDDGSV
jgi:hypothetical protein